MIASLDHFPEPVGEMGGVVSEGILNQLGRPDMDPLELLVREAVQNCWDARAGEQTVRVHIGTQTCSDEALEFLRTEVFREHDGFSAIQKSLTGDSVPLLLISDRGTSGLGGPVRGSTATKGTEPADFVDFLRIIGQPPDKEFGGGTFGFGKAALYLRSRTRCLLVHSKCRVGEELQARFMAAALGSSFEMGGVNYTGRHWWGRRANDGFVDPLIDSAADDAARQLGLPGFEGGERGTTIAILDPDFGHRGQRDAMHFVVHALLWNFWPKMVQQESGRPTMQFEVSVDGEDVDVPNPASIAPFRGFVDAYRSLSSDGKGNDDFQWVGDLECHKPRHHLGTLALRKFPRNERRLPALPAEEDELIPACCHHVALIRIPELVVKYVEGPELDTAFYEYGGVFRADRAMDRIYADSEPPSHDDWINRAVEDRNEKRYVGSTFLRISDRLEAFAGPKRASPDDAGPGYPSLGRLGKHLSSLLPAHSNETAGNSETARNGSKTGGQRKASPRARVNVVGSPRLLQVHGRSALQVSFAISHAEGSSGTVLRAAASAVLDSGERERTPPEGSEVPEVLSWTVDGASHEGTPEIVVQGSSAETSQGTVCISVPRDTSVSVELTARRAGS